MIKFIYEKFDFYWNGIGYRHNNYYGTVLLGRSKTRSRAWLDKATWIGMFGDFGSYAYK